MLEVQDCNLKSSQFLLTLEIQLLFRKKFSSFYSQLVVGEARIDSDTGRSRALFVYLKGKRICLKVQENKN